MGPRDAPPGPGGTPQAAARPPHRSIRLLLVSSPSPMAHLSTALRNAVQASWLVFRLSSSLSQIQGTP